MPQHRSERSWGDAPMVGGDARFESCETIWSRRSRSACECRSPALRAHQWPIG